MRELLLVVMIQRKMASLLHSKIRSSPNPSLLPIKMGDGVEERERCH
nr:hypothetical protein Iba_chr10eCG2600 [Ipomoea batatas]